MVKQFKQIEAIQYTAIRIFLGVHRSYAPLPVIDGDMGWSSCDTKSKVAMFRYRNRLIDMDDSRLPKIGFKLDVELGFINSSSKNMESLFTKLDLSEKFINQQPVSINNVWVFNIT